ncbi:glycosyltransferase family 2 protein [Salegentibacter mishustinae]|jgi:GT2 family glycosyltransferase|uniref:glycosyltransferase family 2 protein n=1 Tax=Salegentibacter mishustinae TaxID=270918 RepID=UPI0024917718|nr:glycosyltransferase [Salegentibacter mishustinae]
MELKQYQTKNGEHLLYTGEPDFNLLEELVSGPGDLWHSSLKQGYQDIFPELVYQTAVFWFYLNDLPNLNCSVNWRINPYSFVVRKKCWEFFNGFSEEYCSASTAALDLGYRMLRFGGAVPLFVDGLFSSEKNDPIIPAEDRYLFFLKNFKNRHSWYMFLRESLTAPIKEFRSFNKSRRKEFKKHNLVSLPSKPLNNLIGKPTVDVIIPTMFRQDYMVQLLEDYKNQTYLPKRVIVVDATPKEERDISLYKKSDYPFELIIKWQKSKGSCKARNEAIELCRSDYIIFADDDTRILPDFVENHLRFLQTYKVDGCTGLDIQASDYRQDLDDLRRILKGKGRERYKAGAAQTFNNANSCVKREWVEEIKGNDINFDGGYGEDADFGFRLIKNGMLLMFNPYSINLHLKPPSGGYRFWGFQSSVLGKKRKRQPWELDKPVGKIRPVPSPTILYGILKHFKPDQVKEYKRRYLFLYLSKDFKKTPLRFVILPFKTLQFNKAMFYAQNLMKRGERF